MFNNSAGGRGRKLFFTSQGTKSLTQTIFNASAATVNKRLYQSIKDERGEDSSVIQKASLVTANYNKSNSLTSAVNNVVRDFSMISADTIIPIFNEEHCINPTSMVDLCRKRRLHQSVCSPPPIGPKKDKGMEKLCSSPPVGAMKEKGFEKLDDLDTFDISSLFEQEEYRNVQNKRQDKKSKTKHQINPNKSNSSKKRLVNHFLAIRVKNKDIHAKVEDIYESVKNKNSNFKHAFIQLPTLHITLNVMSLYGEEEVERAIDALNLSLGGIKSLIEEHNERTLEFCNLNDFHGQVVFVDVKKNDCFYFINELMSIFQTSFDELKVEYKKELSFKPHLTIMKLSKCFKIMKKNGIKRIPQKLYESSRDLYFGDEEVTDILLCSMNDKKSNDGFYKVLASINLNEQRVYKKFKRKQEVDSVSLSDWNIVHKTMDINSEDVKSNCPKEFSSDESWDIIGDDEIEEARIAIKNETFDYKNKAVKTSCSFR